jgi:NAD(P)H-dependent flavin oxidoreductase YrpB (nitropropane dioxygenase family)
MWPNDRFIRLCGIELPIIQAPNARSALSDMIVAVSQAGGLGRLQADALLESIGDLTLVEDWLGNRKLFESRAVCQEKNANGMD